MKSLMLICLVVIVSALIAGGCLTTKQTGTTPPQPTPLPENLSITMVPTETVEPELTPTPTTVPTIPRIPPPIAGFTANTTGGTAPLGVRFTDTSSGSPSAWTWTFGDGNTSDLENPVYTYFTPGTFTVRLVVSNSGGTNSETKVHYISVNPRFVPPGASFSANPPTQAQPFTVQFLDRSSGPPTSWSWDFGDGGTSEEQNPAHTFPGTGTFVVPLEVANPAGTSETTGFVSLG